MQPRDLGLNAGLAHVRQNAVIFVLALIDRKAGIGLEVLGQPRVHKLWPVSRCGRRRRLGRFLGRARSQRQGHSCPSEEA